MESSRFGMESTCRPYEDADLGDLLNNAISNLHAELTDYEVDELSDEEDLSIPADPNVRNFSYTVVDGKLYFRENSRMHPANLPLTTENRVRGMILLRDCVRQLIEYQTENYPDEIIKREQEKLNTLYDNFVKKYGRLFTRGNNLAFRDDSSYCLLCSLEVLDNEGNFERKADMFTKRTIKPHEPVTKVDTSSEALAVSISEKACVDLEYMAELSGKTEEELIADLKGVIYRDIKCPINTEEISPAHQELDFYDFVTADEYLSGNVRNKLKMARALCSVLPAEKRAEIEHCIPALEAVQPEDLSAGEISVHIGTPWIPAEIYQQFMFETFGTNRYAQDRMGVLYSRYNGTWNVTNKSADSSNIKITTTYGTKRINAYHIFEQCLNQKDVRIFDTVIENGKEKPVLNKKETAIAQDRQELIKQKFVEWIWRDIDRREMLCKLYNETYNSIRPREYDGQHIRFTGMNPEISLRPHQINAIAHILYGGNTLLAHEVGAGKTFEMVAAAMELKRLGLCNKSMIVVPNHITEQWAAEWLQLYPAANVLIATERDFEKQNRRKLCARIATGDYDAVIIGHSQLQKIPMSKERQQAIIERQIEQVMVEGYGDGSNPVIDKSEFVLSLFEQLDPRGIDPHEKSIIDRCVDAVYREYKKGGAVPTLRVLRKKLLAQPEEEAQRLALSLELFTSGSLNAFAHETNVDTQNRMVVYDIHDLGRQLKTMGLLVITDAMLNRVTENWRKGKRTHVIVDEFHVVFENEHSAEFFSSAWRRFRKRNAYPTAITQNVEYLLDSVEASTMLSNSEFIVMLNQAASDREKFRP